MTFEALLTFAGILLAALAIVRPVQRRSLMLFVPKWLLPSAIFLSLALIVCRDAPLGLTPPFHWPLPVVLFGLTLGSFLIPVAAALWTWGSWHGAKLDPKNIGFVETVFQTALREREFDEVERIIRSNQANLEMLPASASAVLFSPAMVSALVDSHSWVHLELLGNLRFLQSLENRYAAVDAVIRELLLRSSPSPLRSAVVSKYGGMEHLTYSDEERSIIQRTFQNPEWYFEASAHYPLTISAIEKLRGGKLDAEYNDVGRDYEASQGVSTRAYCPIYLAVKTEVVAIEAALEKRAEDDFYVTDLWDIFRAVQERSRFCEAVWKSPLSNGEYPTPYAYLLYGIAGDLRDLSCKALQAAISQTPPLKVEDPGRIARDLAMSWSFCVWYIAASEGQVSVDFRNSIIVEYLAFMLALGWEPNEILRGASVRAKELHAWLDLFVNELKRRFLGDSLRKQSLREAFDTLDRGKRFVFEGRSWLEKEMFG